MSQLYVNQGNTGEPEALLETDVKDEAYWSRVSVEVNTFPLTALEQFKDDLDWDILSKHYTFTEAGIDHFADLVNWKHIARVSVLSSEFTLKHNDKLMDRFLLDKTTITKAVFLSFNPSDEYIEIWNKAIPEMNTYTWALLTVCLGTHKPMLYWLSCQLLGN